MRLPRVLALLAVPAVSMMVFGTTTADASSSTVMDFENLAEGSTISSLSTGSGISGDAVAGSISVLGVSPAFPGDNSAPPDKVGDWQTQRGRGLSTRVCRVQQWNLIANFAIPVKQG